MAHNLSTHTAIEAARTELYRREASGEVVSEEAWLELGDAQAALLAPVISEEGYFLC